MKPELMPITEIKKMMAMLRPDLKEQIMACDDCVELYRLCCMEETKKIRENN